MPKGSRVGKMYDAMVASGTPKGIAAATAQKRTGQALATGRPPTNRGSYKRRSK